MKYTFIALAPLIIYWAAVEFVISPPFWHHWNHWELTMYYTAMDLVDGFPVHIASNPGTPVQLIGYLVLKIIGTDPDQYPLFLLIVRTLILFSVAGSVWFFQRFAFDESKRALSIACIWFYFSFNAALTYLNVWAAEALYLPLGLLFCVLFLRLIQDQRDMKDMHVLLTGLSLGALVTLKFNFLPWVIAFYLVLLFSNNKRRVWVNVRTLTMATLGLVFAFALITAPVRDQYEYMARLLIGWVFTDGASSPGEESPVQVSEMFGNWAHFVSDFWPCILILLVVLVLFARYQKPNVPRQLKTILLFAAVSSVLSLAMISRMYESRYMLPVGLAGLLVLSSVIRSLPFQLTLRSQKITLLTSFMILAFVMARGIDRTADHVDAINKTYQELQARLNDISEKNGIESPVIIFGWPIPHPAAAMRHQPYYEEHQQSLDAIYPETGTFVPWRNYVRLPPNVDHWDLAVFPVSSLPEVRQSRLPILSGGTEVISYLEEFEVVSHVNNLVIVKPELK